MHESLLVLMMVLSPVSSTNSSVWYDWKPGGYYPTKAACENMAQKIYEQQKVVADRMSKTDEYGGKRIANAMIGHVCGDDPVKLPVKK